MSWAQIEAKQGETISRYVHSFGTADSVTKLKPSTWAAPTTIRAAVRSQPGAVELISAGIFEKEVIVVLTDTTVSKRDRFAWNSKYWEVVVLDEVWFKGTKQYYKCTCVEVVQWSPPTA